MSSIKQRLKTLLFKNNLTPTELARHIDLPQQTIQRIAQGTSENPRAATIEKIASHFDISPDQLLGKAPLFLDNDNGLSEPTTQSIPVFTFEQLHQTDKKTLSTQHHEQIIVSAEYHPDTFAVVMNDTSMQPYFDKGCLLIIEPKDVMMDMDFVLIKNMDNHIIQFRQAISENQTFYLKALNPNSPSFQAQLLTTQDQLLGVLVETRQVFSRRPKEFSYA